MANLFKVTVTQINGNPFKQPQEMAFFSADVLIQEDHQYSPNNAFVEYSNNRYYTNDTAETIINAANQNSTEQFETNIINIDGNPFRTPIKMGLPIKGVLLSPVTNIDGANTSISFKNKIYYAVETVDALVTESNSGLDPVAPVTGANPTAKVGLTADNGNSTQFMRSDAAPPIDQSIAPTWTGLHIFQRLVKVIQNVTGNKVLLGMVDPGTASTANGVLGATSTYLQVGGGEWGANTYRLISFGYVNPDTNHAPAFIGYQEKTTSGNTFGDIIIGTRPNNSNVAPTIICRITAAGQITAENIAYAPTLANSLANKKYIDDLINAIPSAYTNKGNWNATTNVPALANGVGTNGDTYIVSVAGTHDFGAGPIAFVVGDKVIYLAGSNIWQKFESSENVVMVNGQTGVVTITKADVGLGNVDNTADADKPVSGLQAAAIALKVNTADKATNAEGEAGTDNTKWMTPATTKAAIDTLSAAPANPSATAAMTAKNGTAATFMRSDGAPAIDPAIVPTWTGIHNWINHAIFAAASSLSNPTLALTSANPQLDINYTDAVPNGKRWNMIGGSGGFAIRALNDDGSVARNMISATRTVTAISIISFGNATDNPNFTFLGSGVTAVGGNLNVQGNISSASNTSPAGVTNTGIMLVGNPNNADVLMFDSTRTVDNRTCEMIFFQGAQQFRFKNDAGSTAVVWLSAVGGQASGVTGITSSSGTGNWEHTGGLKTTKETILSSGYTVATLPAASVALRGARAFVTDASVAAPAFMSATIGGGANTVPVFCTGTTWVYA